MSLLLAFADLANRTEDSTDNVNQNQMFDFDLKTLDDNSCYADEVMNDLKNKESKRISFTAPEKVKEKCLQHPIKIKETASLQFSITLKRKEKPSTISWLEEKEEASQLSSKHCTYQLLYRLFDLSLDSDPNFIKIPTERASVNIGG